MVRSPSIDEIDKKILDQLKSNSRKSFVKIARDLGLSEAGIRKRVKKLLNLKIIKKFTALIDYKKLGMVQSFTGIDVNPEKLWDVINKLKNIEEIKTIWLTTGDHMLMLEIVTDSMDKLSKLHEEISKLEGVNRVCPAVVLEILKF